MGRISVLSFLFLVVLAHSARAHDDCEYDCDPPTADVLIKDRHTTVLVEDVVKPPFDVPGGGLVGLGTTTWMKNKDGDWVAVDRGRFGKIWSVKVFPGQK